VPVHINTVYRAANHVGSATIPCQLIHFPCKYLGIPLSAYALKKSVLLPLVDRVVDRLPEWKSRFMSRAGQTSLAKSTLSAILIHVSIAIAVSPWIYHAIDKVQRAFILTGTSEARGGQCMVSRAKVARPVELGRLGVLDLTTLGYALRLF
jgi:hypothetical protein